MTGEKTYAHNTKPSAETPYHVTKVRLTFLDEVLGTASANPEIHSEYIASKAPDAPSRKEEIEAIGVDEYEEKAMTVFPRKSDDPNAPIFWNYQIRGFFKEACSMLQKAKNKYASPASLGIRAYKKIIDGNIFVAPREIQIDMNGLRIDSRQRPLRAQTAQGERVALANSEAVPASTSIEFSICDISGGAFADAIHEWLDYGISHGIGQWRNSGKGAFDWEELESYYIGRDELKEIYKYAE